MTVKEEILIMKQRVGSMDDKLNDIDEKLDSLMLKLLDPEEGLVVRVNKNTNRLDVRDKNMGKWMKDIEDFNHMKKWKHTVTKALWVIYAGIIGFVIKIVFWE